MRKDLLSKDVCLRFRLSKAIVLSLIFLFVSFQGWGQSIFTNPITGTTPNLSNPYIAGQIVNSNITVSGIGRGSGIAGSSANDRYNANSWDTSSIDLTQYFEFTLTPKSGYKIDFTSFVYTGQASGSGPTSFSFRSSLDGYIANVGVPTASGSTISLSGTAFQNITASVTFRLYGWGASAATGTFSINDFTFNGNITSAVADTTAPTLVSLSPADNATNVAVNTNLVLTFDENIKKGAGNIIVKKSNDNSIVQTIDVTNATVSGATVTIDPPTDLANSTGYYVEMASGVIQDIAGNNFSGITGASAWNFTTVVPSYNIVATQPTSGGSISPAGTTTVLQGSNQTFTTTASGSCYTFDHWVVDGSNAGNASNYTFANVTASHTISAVYNINPYTISATTGANGSITPSGATAVNCGSNQVYTFTPNSGYVVEDVLVDGVSVGAVTTYTFSNVMVAHTISVTFKVYIGPCFTMNATSFGTSGSTFAGDVDSGGSPTTTIRLATGSAAGTISTITSGVAAGSVTVRFRAKAWSASETNVTVNLGGQSVLITDLPTSFGWVERTFNGVSANPTLSFVGAAGKRVHIGNVEVYCTPSTTPSLEVNTGILDFGTVCNGNTSAIQSFTVSGANLTAGNISIGALMGYSYSETPTGTFTNTLTFAQSGGTLTNKIIYVKLTPTAANATYNGNVSISGGGATAVSKALTGNSNAQVASINTNTIATSAATTATLRANNIVYGTCPATTTNGFVYSVASVNATPTIANGATNVSVTLNNLNTTFTQGITGLAEGTTYAVQAYLYDGTTYTYGGVQTFTTAFSGTLNNVTATKACLTDGGGTISWTAPASGVVPTGYMLFAVTGATTPTGTPTTALTDYANANSNYSVATNNATPTTLGKLLYKGNATSVDISGLTENTAYSFMVLAYQEGGSLRRFAAGTAASRALGVSAQDDVKTFVETPSNGQVTLNWTHNSAASCFDEVLIVANQGAVNFVPSGDGSSYLANDIYSSANQVVYKGTANSKAITGFTNGTEYCFKIFLRRGTTWSDGASVCATPDIVYCPSNGDMLFQTGLTYVKFKEIENANPTKTQAYTNYSTPKANVVRGEVVPLAVRVNTAGDFLVNTKAWIDWNHDGDFADSGEEFDLGTAFGQADGATTLSPINITIPNTAYLGNVRMRISAMYDTVPTSCATDFDGEVEDYTITITQPTGPEINIKGGGISIPNNFEEPYGLNNTLFASTSLGSDSIEKEFTIENLGLANLNLAGTPIVNIVGLNPSDFVVTQQAVSPVVNGVATSFKIKFHPTAAGVRQADVSIANNDSDENPYVFRIQGTGTCANSLSVGASPSSGPVNTIVTFTSSVDDLSGATITYNGIAVPLLSVSSNKIEVALPAGSLDSNFILKLPTGCSFTHDFDVVSSVTTNCEASSGGSSATPASNLIIYEVYDEKVGSGGVISLFNRTGATVDLSGYSISRAGDYGGTYSTIANLSGTIATNAVAVIGISGSNCGVAPTGNGSFGSTGFNENDGFRLMKAASIIDDVHAPNITGYYLKRKNEYLSPNSIFDANEWTNQALSAGQCLPATEVAQPPVTRNPPLVNTQPTYSLSCDVASTSLAITATEGFAGGNGLTFQWYELGSTGNWNAISEGGVYSGTTSQTLMVSDVTGLNNYQYYCQVRENTATCFTATNAARIKEASNTWSTNVWSNGTPVLASKVIIAGNYDTQLNGALDVCELTVVNPGTVVVKPNNPITVKKRIINNNTAANSFIVESDANLLQVDNVINEGNVKVERNVVDMNNISTHMDYVYWSSPVSDQTIKGASGFSPNTPNSGFQQYNEPTDKFTVTTDSKFLRAKGYAVRAESGVIPGSSPSQNYGDGYAKTYAFTGVPFNGSFTSQNLQKSTGTDKGYNLIGNPYPSNIDFDLLYGLNGNEAKMYCSAFFWTNNTFTPQQMGSGYTGNNYAIYNGTGGSPATYDTEDTFYSVAPNGKIKVGQAFIIQAKLAGTIDFDNSIRVSDNGTFYQKGAAKNRFWLTMTSPNNLVNTILIGYIAGATNNYEKDFDGELFSVGSDSFYSILGAKKLAIQGKADDFSVEDKIPVGNVYSINGNYTIKLQTGEGIFNQTQNIYLKDKLLNKTINLSNGDYTFTAVKGTDATRFEIVYKDDLVLGTDAATKSDFIVYKDGTDYVIKSSKSLGNVEVYDAAGRMVVSKKTKANSIRLDVAAFINGVYIIKAENSGDVRTKKVIK